MYFTPFDPLNLTPNASINRAKLIDVPGLPAELRGKTAYQLLGRQALIERILARFPELQSEPDLPFTFDWKYLGAGVSGAAEIAAETGHCLGYLLLTLKQGHEANRAADRAARPDWDASHWAHWGQMERVIIGGGLMSGHLGLRMVEAAGAMLNGLCRVERSIFAANLPLIGVARHAPVETRAVRVFDFGQTAVKVGTAYYTDGTLTTLDVYPSRTAPEPGSGANVLRRMTEIVQDVVQSHPVNVPLMPLYLCSIASYVMNGQPAIDGFYGKLKELSDDVTDLLAHEFSAAPGAVSGGTVSVRLMHDGTSAAQVYAGSARTAVITMGTALGIGFAPPAEALRPLALRSPKLGSPDLHLPSSD